MLMLNPNSHVFLIFEISDEMHITEFHYRNIFNGRLYGRPFVPVDTDSVIHKLFVLLVLQFDGAHEVYTERLERTIPHYVFPISH